MAERRDGEAKIEEIVAKIEVLTVWLEQQLIAPDVLLQVIAIVTAFILAVTAVKLLRPLVKRIPAVIPQAEKAFPYLKPLVLPFLWLVWTALAQALFDFAGYRSFLLRPAASLLVAWLLIRIVSLFIRNRELGRLFTLVAWTVTALIISGMLNPALTLLDNVALTLGSARISVLDVVQGLFIFVAMIWFALVMSKVLDQSLTHFPTLTPSAQVLLAKLGKILLVTVAILAAISSSGIDLTALAVFSGALGLGIGFGLQRVFSNLISGVLLLTDRSIKPGDVIELDQGQTYGWINKLAARYTSVITRDGREHLIPNEDMVTQTVVNWTYSNTKVRRHIPIRLSYRADLRHAMDLILEAATETKRVLADPEPRVLIKEFGDDAFKLELRIWISDPHNGVANVASDVLLKVWDKFQDNGIQIPYPQHDVHLTSAAALDPDRIQEIMDALQADPPPQKA